VTYHAPGADGSPGGGARELMAGSFDVTVANILSRPLIALAPTIASFPRPGGAVVLAGLLEDQAPPIIEAYAKEGVSLRLERVVDGWALLVGHKA
jgi:ribosomal protein L11 methyltransferase